MSPAVYVDDLACHVRGARQQEHKGVADFIRIAPATRRNALHDFLDLVPCPRVAGSRPAPGRSLRCWVPTLEPASASWLQALPLTRCRRSGPPRAASPANRASSPRGQAARVPAAWQKPDCSRNGAVRLIARCASHSARLVSCTGPPRKIAALLTRPYTGARPKARSMRPAASLGLEKSARRIQALRPMAVMVSSVASASSAAA